MSDSDNEARMVRFSLRLKLSITFDDMQVSGGHDPGTEIAQTVNCGQSKGRAFTRVCTSTQFIHQNKALAIRLLQDTT